MRFWDQASDRRYACLQTLTILLQLMAAVRILKTEGAIENTVYQQFIKTNQWLTPFRF